MDEQFLRRLPSSDSSPASVKDSSKMLHSAGYRLTFHPAHVRVCPLCALPGNPRVPLQPCCLYPGELCPESHVEFPVNSLLALRSPSYGFPTESLNMTSFSPHHFQSSTVDLTHAQPARTNRDDINSNTVRADPRQQRCTAGNKRKRRKRTIFTCEQLSRLESEFADQQYMVGAERQQLAEALNLSETQIKIWFQNRRIKWRKENKQEYPDFLASAFSAMAYEARHPTASTEAWNDGGNLGSSSKVED